MTTIAATTSPSIGAALAALISGGSNASDGGSSGSPSNASPSGSTPQYGVSVATNVTLSDHAKAVLAQAKVDQVLAQQLSAQVAAGKSGGSGSQPAAPESIEQIVASAKQVQAANSAADASAQNSSASSTNIFDSLNDPLDAQLQSYFAAHKQADGTYSSFSVTENDVTIGSFTSQQADQWYTSQQGKAFLWGEQNALAVDPTGPGAADAAAFIQAYNSHTLVIKSAADVPDLNLHNTIVFQGGEGGGSINGTVSYNEAAPIFQDKFSFTSVNGDGYVVSWKLPSQSSPAS